MSFARIYIMDLPILSYKETIVAAAKKYGRIVISSPPASGKSTQVPQMLADAGLTDKTIAVVEPRRIAAKMLARRVAGERKTRCGVETGYKVRFENCSGPDTRILFLTDGMLAREMTEDPLLKKYGSIIFDEFHERRMNGDMCLAFCRRLQRGARPDMTLAVMSATLDEKELAVYLSPCGLVKSEGKNYPVAVNYCDKESEKLPVWLSAARAAALLVKRTSGNCLIFMPGVYEINRTVSELESDERLAGFEILPLHGELKLEQQEKAVSPGAGRKIIVSTNIAETSLTIDGVTSVVDSGLQKTARYDGGRAVNTLFTEPAPLSSAKQRAGRAGRDAPGICLRLWSKNGDSIRPEYSEPEIKRTDLSESLLALKAAGIKNFGELEWLTDPGEKAEKNAEDLLLSLGAADKNGGITGTGKAMARYSLPPRYARMMTEAERKGCPREAALIAAAAQTRGNFISGGKNYGGSDPADCARALARAAADNFSEGVCSRLGINRQQAAEAWKTARQLAQDVGYPTEAGLREAVKCFITAFPDRIGILLSGYRYAITGGKKGTLENSSAAAGCGLICFGRAVEKYSGAGTDISLSFAAGIEAEWLSELFPSEISVREEKALDEEMRIPAVLTKTYYRDIAIASEKSFRAGKDMSELIAEEFISGRQKFKSWDEKTEEWLRRLRFTSAAFPELEISPLSEEDRKLIFCDICSGAKSVSDAGNRQVLPALRDWYGWDICRLVDRHAPERLRLPSGKTARIIYPDGGEPYLDIKIQDLAGLTETPRIAGGRVPLLLHILAPSMRPVQVTKDLASFWKESYPKLRPWLARRYPKHRWPAA